ncbi:MAG: nickel/cobalt transporter (NiCoT) family protein [Miltoncostaeaceae bacterium]|nr:nickel/cobalt transporter (NiCoT) family protein [Miltoncostaeaceae bacterium]
MSEFPDPGTATTTAFAVGRGGLELSGRRPGGPSTPSSDARDQEAETTISARADAAPRGRGAAGTAPIRDQNCDQPGRAPGDELHEREGRARHLVGMGRYTGLSVAVALVIGSIELVGVAHDQLGFVNPVSDWIASLDLNNVGFVVVGVFMAVWAAAIGYWRIARVEHRWSQPRAETKAKP